jgi:mRNA-degrading endonuclease toxin of MazEF toxin-antitoxin module
MKPGDVWVIDIPELKTHEQNGRRPAVIIARVTKNIVTFIPFTTNKKALRFPLTCTVAPTKSNGLREESIALVFQMSALDTSYFEHKVGSLEKKAFEEIRTLARRLIG